MQISRKDTELVLRKWATEERAIRGTFSRLKGGIDITFCGVVTQFDQRGLLIAHSIKDPTLGTVLISLSDAIAIEFQTGDESPPGDELSASVETALIIRFTDALLALYEQESH